mgnify:CR=1 FL=1
MNVAVVGRSGDQREELIQQLAQCIEHLMVRKAMLGSLENLAMVINAMTKELFVTVTSKKVEMSLV